MINFDQSLYERPVRAPVLDTMDLGSFKVTPDDLRDKWTPSANKRHNKGEHSTIVIGHTRDGMTREEDQPTVVGVLTGPFAYHDSYPGIDGPCMSGLHWINKERVVPLEGVPVKLSAKEILDRFPRRSAELWRTDYKIDPHCLLGATTPCRELGPLRLARNGEEVVTHEIPYRLSLPKETPVATEATPTSETSKDDGVHKQLEALTAQVMKLTQALAELTSGGDGAAAPAAGGAGGSDPNEEAELEQLLAQLGASQGQETPAPAPSESPKKMSRTKEQELETEVATLKIKDQLRELGLNDEAKDAQLISDLSILPPDAYTRQITRLQRAKPAASAAELAKVVAEGNATVAAEQQKGQAKKITTEEEKESVVKLAREKQISFGVAAKELGFEVVVK